MKHVADNIEVTTKENNNNSLLLIILVSVFIVGFVFGYFYPIYKQYQSAQLIDDSDIKPISNSEENNKNLQINIPLNPPELAIDGDIAILSNTVEVLPRYSTDWVNTATKSAVLQEEQVRTDETGKATVILDDIVIVNLDTTSLVSFINLISGNLLLRQNSGDVNYLINKPISIKVSDTLTSMKNGELDISIDKDSDFFYMDIALGSGKIAFINNDNQTKVYNITKGDKVTYNPENTTIVIN